MYRKIHRLYTSICLRIHWISCCPYADQILPKLLAPQRVKGWAGLVQRGSKPYRVSKLLPSKYEAEALNSGRRLSIHEYADRRNFCCSGAVCYDGTWWGQGFTRVLVWRMEFDLFKNLTLQWGWLFIPSHEAAADGVDMATSQCGAWNTKRRPPPCGI